MKDLKIDVDLDSMGFENAKFVTLRATLSNYKTCQYRISLNELNDDEQAGNHRKRIAADFAKNLFTEQIHDVLITALMKAAIAGKFKP